MSQPEPIPVFVVEDDDHIGMLLRFILQRSGFQVTLATDGRMAMQHLETQAPPAVALFDVMLPYHDGYELVARLRSLPAWERVPVLMLTAKAQERDVARALEAGADEYLAKPFEPQELIARVRRLAGVAG